MIDSLYDVLLYKDVALDLVDELSEQRFGGGFELLVVYEVGVVHARFYAVLRLGCFWDRGYIRMGFIADDGWVPWWGCEDISVIYFSYQRAGRDLSRRGYVTIVYPAAKEFKPENACMMKL